MGVTASDTTVVLYIYFHRLSAYVVIVAEGMCKVITFIDKFSYNYDFATYSVTMNSGCIENSVTPETGFMYIVQDFE